MRGYFQIICPSVTLNLRCVTYSIVKHRFIIIKELQVHNLTNKCEINLIPKKYLN